MKLLYNLSCAILTVIIFSHCGKNIDEFSNNPPVANAGRDTSITLPVDSIKLDGSSSYDADGQIIIYEWRRIEGPGFISTNLQIAQPLLKNLKHSFYKVELKVTDNQGLSDLDTVTFTVNTPGIANTTYQDCSAFRPEVKTTLMPIATLSVARTNMAVASAGNKIVFAGGETGVGNSARVDIFDLSTNLWSTAELSEARTEIATAVLGKKIFFAGGGNNSGGYSGKVDIYDTETNTWTTANLPNEYQAPMSAAAAGTKVVLAHGFNYHIYDAMSNSWSTKYASGIDPNFTPTPLGIAATALENNIYFAGSTSDCSVFPGGPALQVPCYTSGGIAVYNVVSNTWSSIGQLIEPKGYAAAIAVGPTAFWAGGYTGDSNHPFGGYMSSRVEMRDISNGQVTIGCLFQPNAKFAAVQKNNNIIFFTGEGPQKDKFDIYNINSKNWSVGVLPQRLESSAIISVNNIAYVAGGKVNGVLTNQVYKLEF